MFGHDNTTEIPVSRALKLCEHSQEGQFLYFELGGQFNDLAPVLPELFFVFLLEGPVLSHLSQAVGGRLLEYSMS